MASIIILYLLYDEIFSLQMTDVIKNIFLMLVPGLIGLLGFLVAGLAMMASIITKEAILKIDEKKKSKSLVGILFSFYFEGFIVGLNIVLMILSYILVSFPQKINFYIFMILAFLISYIFWFSIIYAITLLGTCINFFFVNVYYNDSILKQNNKKSILTQITMANRNKKNSKYK
ncbi:hypothetical protein [Pectinatus haikarae]|uniref:Uncharacterized protein n=2 Tax=Pectinatus haikarae TaxID=349096 RepID=A0ABT9Y3U2_9FIRM|nr:hypothetical protein [Pectinatus haikarae]MDQ0202492.1 hypothetical protein [Pectinatus haikarae]